MGIGNAGLKVSVKLAAMPEAGFIDIVGIDTDRKDLAEAGLPQSIGTAFDWTQGEGCGGNPTRGERGIAKARDELEQLIADRPLLVVVGGLGGGTATGGGPVIAGVAKKCRIPALFVMTMPFSFEGGKRREVAEHGAEMLTGSVMGTLIRLPNDLLFSTMPAETPAFKAFEMADDQVAKAVAGICEILRCDDLIAADIADIREALGNGLATSGIGVGEGNTETDGGDRAHIAVERLAASPLLGGPDALRNSDCAIITLLGGPDAAIAEFKQCLTSIERLTSPQTKLVVGTSIDESRRGRMRLVAITVKFENSQAGKPVAPERLLVKHPVKAAAPSGPTTQGQQPELPLQNFSKGIFTNAQPTIVDGQDLDVPTFLRKGVVIDQGGTNA